MKPTHGAGHHQVHHQHHPALPGEDGDGDLFHWNAVHLERATSLKSQTFKDGSRLRVYLSVEGVRLAVGASEHQPPIRQVEGVAQL